MQKYVSLMGMREKRTSRFDIQEKREDNGAFAANLEVMKINKASWFCNFIFISLLWNVGENKLKNYRFGVLICHTKHTPP